MGHGTGFSVDSIIKKNNYSDRFRVELSFVATLKKLYPNDKIAIIKYARGATALDSLAGTFAGSWDTDFSGINQYDHFLATLRNAFRVKDINQDGKEDVLIPQGIIWMRGESDASHTEEVAREYYTNLKLMMKLQRSAFHQKDLPVVIGKISDGRKDKNEKT